MFAYLPRLIAVAGLACAAPLCAETPRDLLTHAAFVDRDKGQALARVERARDVAAAALRRDAHNQEAAVILATANGYRAKLTGSRSEAVAARKGFEALVRRFPQSAEAHAALGAWHVGVIAKVGRLVGRAAVGAQKHVGLAALDRAVALSGNRALFPGLAALLRLELDAEDAQARTLAERAARAPVPTSADAAMRRASTAVLETLRSGNRAAAAKLADRLLPFGMVAGVD